MERDDDVRASCFAALDALGATKGFHGSSIVLPSRAAWRPDRTQLAERFERFSAG
jgi:hypothetical protein